MLVRGITGNEAKSPSGIGFRRTRVMMILAGRRKDAITPPIEKIPQSIASKSASLDFKGSTRAEWEGNPEDEEAYEP